MVAMEKKSVFKIAELAKIEIDSREEKKFEDDLSDILVWCEKLMSIETPERNTNFTPNPYIEPNLRKDESVKNPSLESSYKKNGYFITDKVIK
jgi:aspartyl/glutamyl-tRNA(Asn/Gln) amidotransferase C subunit